MDHFATSYNRYPGVFDEEDVSRLKIIGVGLLNDVGCVGANLSEDLISEMYQFGASKLHCVATFVGGIASQEVIKLIT